MRRQVRDVAVPEQDRAGPRQHQPGERAQQRRLAGSIRADEGHDLSLVQIEIEIPQHAAITIAYFQRSGGKQAHTAIGRAWARAKR